MDFICYVQVCYIFQIMEFAWAYPNKYISSALFFF